MIKPARPKDYWGDARKHPAGGGWIAIYRLPWKARPEILRNNGRPIVYATESEALRASMNHTHNLMCPHITSQSASSNARAQAERHFKKGENVGSA